MVTVIITSKTEVYLKQTTLDILSNATGDIEIIVCLDGYMIPADEIVTDRRVRYLPLPPTSYAKKRHGINFAVDIAKGEYIMASDAHCMFAKGFDEQLVKDHQPDWVQIPRRNRLDAEHWCLQPQADKRPPIDYEYIMFPPLVVPVNSAIHGFKWDSRTLERWNIPIDDTMHFQASVWFMTKEWYKKMGFMQIEGYTGWGQEAEEIGFTTRLNGGRIITNKNTWYAHLHKGRHYGRMYHANEKEIRVSYNFAYDYWIHKHKEFFINLVNSFWPINAWPDDWEKQLYG